MRTDDKILADAVRSAAEKLAAAMNHAGNAGLLMEVTFRSHMHENFSNGDTKATGWLPLITIWRTEHV